MFQRNQSPFVTFVHKIECYSCHKFGHVVANCKSRMYRLNRHRLQKYQKPQRLANRYNNGFYGYCYSCNLFGHKAYDYRSNQWRWTKLHARYRFGMSSRIFYPPTPYLSHMERYVVSLVIALQLKLSTRVSCKIRGGSAIWIVSQIILMPSLVMASHQGVQTPFLHFNYSESTIENWFLTMKMEIPFVQLVDAN